MKKAKENRIGEQCSEIEENMRKNNSKRAYQMVKDLTTVKVGESDHCSRSFRKMPHRRATNTEPMDRILLWAVQLQGQWRSISTELSPDRHEGWPPHPSQRSGGCSAIIEEREVGRSRQHPAELVQVGGEDVITALMTIWNKMWQRKEWPTSWTQSLVIAHPKKGKLQQCQNYRTVSLVSHPSKVMLKIILIRLKPQAEKIIAEEQAGFRAGRSTTEQIFNIRILCEKYLQHQQDLYHVFIDFKKAFDRVWHAAVWATMK